MNQTISRRTALKYTGITAGGALTTSFISPNVKAMKGLPTKPKYKIVYIDDDNYYMRIKKDNKVRYAKLFLMLNSTLKNINTSIFSQRSQKDNYLFIGTGKMKNRYSYYSFKPDTVYSDPIKLDYDIIRVGNRSGQHLRITHNGDQIIVPMFGLDYRIRSDLYRNGRIDLLMDEEFKILYKISHERFGKSKYYNVCVYDELKEQMGMLCMKYDDTKELKYDWVTV